MSRYTRPAGTRKKPPVSTSASKAAVSSVAIAGDQFKGQRGRLRPCLLYAGTIRWARVLDRDLGGLARRGGLA